MNELERKKLKEGLEQCEKEATCSGCPYFSKIGCKKHLYQDALALIKEQEQKIFELENRLKECENGYKGTSFLDRCKLHDAEEKIKKLTARNEKLESMRTIDDRYKFCNIIGDAYIYTKTLEDYNKLRADFRIDTVQKFAERLKKFYGNFKGASQGYVIEYHIDQIAEELRKEIQDAAHG